MLVRQWPPVLALLALALLLAAGCGSGGATPTPEGLQQVRGHIVEVVDRSTTEVETLRIRDADGQMWTFTTEGHLPGFDPAHLRLHQVLGQTVLVTYEVRGNELVAVNMED